MTELSANDVKFISSDRQELDLSKCISYGTVNSIFVEIQPDSTNIKNDPRIPMGTCYAHLVAGLLCCINLVIYC